MTDAPAIWPVLGAGTWVDTGSTLDVQNPYDGSLVGRTVLGRPADLDEAVAGAVRAAPAIAAMPAFERAAILRRVAARLTADRAAFAQTLALEAGKPIRDAGLEVDRAVLTFSVAADEAVRIGGEYLSMDRAAPGVGRVAMTRRVPIGPVAAISPFNFPMNLAAHKLAPAIAAGNPIVLKPATKTPLSALTLARLLMEAGAPAGSVSVLPLTRELGDRLVTDSRFRLLTFTGSAAVGWDMKARAGRKRVVLELGGNAGVIVDRDADVDFAVSRLVPGGFTYAGQSCISVQRVYVHESRVEELSNKLVDAVSRLVLGHPLDPAADLSSMVDPGEADRVAEWVAAAVQTGARVLTGGRRVGRAGYEPTVLTGVASEAKICAEEAFAPLVGLYPFSDFAGAIDAVNRSRYGLQAGVFTRTLEHAWLAFDRLEVGGVIVNDVPSFRIDHMPYGGVKDSGLGREGPRHAIDDMTELRLLVINRQP